MKTINYQNWQLTAYKQREDDESPIGATSPVDNRPASSGNVSRLRTGALVYSGVRSAQMVFQAAAANVKTVTGSTRQQEQVNDMVKSGTFIARTFATKGFNLLFEVPAAAVQYHIRSVNNRVENEIREADNKLLGARRNMGGYYD